MISVTIQGYLTQGNLADALRKIVGSAWRQKELPVSGCRRRWDMAFSHEGSTTVVEYDGDEHYCNTLKIKADIEKDQKVRSEVSPPKSLRRWRAKTSPIRRTWRS